MICQRIMVGGKGKKGTWSIRVNTEATTAGAKKTGIPFNLYGQPGVRLEVDWGDGTSSTLTSADYTLTNANASVHTYSSAGVYDIQFSCTKWSSCYLLASHAYNENINQNLPADNNAIAALKLFQQTLVAVDALPRIKGMCVYDSNSNPGLLKYQEHSVSFLFERCTHLTVLADYLFSNNPQAIYFSRTFLGCVSLVTVPGNIFSGVTSGQFVGTFQGCLSLASIPANLFLGVNSSTFENCFSQCERLTTIPANLFASSTAANSFASCFIYCTSLASIPSSLFASQTNAQNFNQCFCGSGISAIPDGLFDACSLATNFRRVFSDCADLATIPPFLFRFNTLATTFEGAFGAYPSSVERGDYNGIPYSFRGVENDSLTQIPSTLFATNSAVTSFETTFRLCTALTSIPSNLFAFNPNVQTFREVFRSCTALTGIPQGLFDAVGTSLKDMTDAFAYDGEITSIPASLFTLNTEITTFSGTFSFTGVESIPSTLFRTNTKVTSFNGTFNNCQSLTGIPANLFDYNTEVLSFAYVFNGCTPIDSIPASIFVYNTKVIHFYNAFSNCPNITSIPSALFATNTAATLFGSVFFNTRIESIPATLFANNTEATSFSDAFAQTLIRDVPVNLFSNNTKITSVIGIFASCVYLGSFSLRFTSPDINLVSSALEPFVDADAGATRTIYVPANSTTETTFNAEASTLGLTIIGE